METTFDEYFEQCLLDQENETDEATLGREYDPEYWDEEYENDDEE